MFIIQKKANYPEVSVLKLYPGKWEERDLCQENITPDCLKRAGGSAMSTEVVSSFTKKKMKSQHSTGRFRVIINGINNPSPVP